MNQADNQGGPHPDANRHGGSFVRRNAGRAYNEAFGLTQLGGKMLGKPGVYWKWRMPEENSTGNNSGGSNNYYNRKNYHKG